MEAKRRELRDSETFSSRGEMFTNMSLWREERGPNPSISGWADPAPGSHCCPFPAPDASLTVSTNPLCLSVPFTHILALPPREFCSR